MSVELRLLVVGALVLTACPRKVRTGGPVIDQHGLKMVAIEPGSRRIAWSELSGLKLSYYSTRRDRREGWMQLVVQGPGDKLRFDSRLENFAHLAAHAARAASARNLPLSASTVSNLDALGVTVGPRTSSSSSELLS